MRFRKILVVAKPTPPDMGALHAAARLASAAGAGLVTLDPTGNGVPAVEIARAAEREAADLIIIEREPLEVVEGAVRRARVPCLVVPREEPTFRRILAAVDGGPDSAEILSLAAAIGELFGGDVTSVHVEPCAPVQSATRSWAWGADRAAVATAGTLLVRSGDPVAEIVKLVHEEGIDLLVHGHHRCGPANGHETGSVAARLLRRAPCAVLTVPI